MKKITRLIKKEFHRPVFDRDVLKTGFLVEVYNKYTQKKFKGICIAFKRKGIKSTVTIRGIYDSVGVELTVPLISKTFFFKKKPFISKRKSKLYFLRNSKLNTL